MTRATELRTLATYSFVSYLHHGTSLLTEQRCHPSPHPKNHRTPKVGRPSKVLHRLLELPWYRMLATTRVEVRSMSCWMLGSTLEEGRSHWWLAVGSTTRRTSALAQHLSRMTTNLKATTQQAPALCGSSSMQRFDVSILSLLPVRLTFISDSTSHRRRTTILIGAELE